MAKGKTRSKKTVIIGVMLIAAAAIWGFIRLISQDSAGIPGSTDRERTAYIESFGYKVGTVPDKIEEIRIPANFDEAYGQYNAIQLEQGFDLRKYRAYYAKKYTYSIKNYDSGSPVPICANLIVIDGIIVGADISSSEAGGLLTVLAKK
ncbi:MAG: DUF4830 domain-containing protein [Oscillospiraceae bacterium]|nr:DUF4830 domain-containing protein [Oscillospiraceae bacterium]